MHLRRSRASTSFVTLTLGVLMHALSAQAAQPAYPAKPVQLIVPFTAGGPTDIFARALGRHMAEALGQGFVIVNRDGAGGVIGTEAAARAPADGYTLLFSGSGPLAIEAAFGRPLSYDPQRDLAPIGLFANIPFILLVHPSVPATSVRDLVALAHRNPGKLNNATVGSGGATFLASELFKSMTKTVIVNVPYKGAALSVTSLLGGEVDMSFIGAPSAVAFLRSNRLRALATTGSLRLEIAPELPTLAQAGVAGYEFTQWYGLLAPGRTPRHAISTLHGALSRAIVDPEVMRRVAEQGGAMMSSTPEQFGAFIATEAARAEKTIRGAGIKSG